MPSIHPRARALSLAAVAFAAGLLSAARPQDPQDPEKPDTELAHHMETVEDGLRLLRRAVRKPEEQRDEALATLAACEEAALFCKGQRPLMLERVPEAERADFLRDYRLGMIELQEALLALERGLLEGRDVEQLKELHKALSALEDPAHERFTDGG